MVKRSLWAGIVAVSLAMSVSAVSAQRVGETETGVAAVYADTLSGHRTANGERYDRTKLTAAHKTLPFGTTIKVTNTQNNKSVLLRINDRGPFQASRMLDLSAAAATQLGINRRGMREVTLEILELGVAKRASSTAP
ncbi:MAG: septal ring lytic transglycosylase RlpA family protein [Vicinamibacterales bacterium]